MCVIRTVFDGVRTAVCPVDKQTWRFLRRVHDATSVQREYTGRGSDLAVVVPEQNETVARSTSQYTIVCILYPMSIYCVYGGKGAEFLQMFFFLTHSPPQAEPCWIHVYTTYRIRKKKRLFLGFF